jgi:hypothetical protein
MTQEHPITPTPELITKWIENYFGCAVDGTLCDLETAIATRAAQWGADQELEACCEYLVRCAQWEPEDVEELRSARRPKPPSLKEQALEELEQLRSDAKSMGMGFDAPTIRRALEQLDD